MEFKHPRHTVRSGPEIKGARRLRAYMRARGWLTIKLHGGKYQSGLPDILAMHPIYGIRWIETKAPGGKLSQSQVTTFAMFDKFGQQVYVCEDEQHYSRLFLLRGNWMEYVR